MSSKEKLQTAHNDFKESFENLKEDFKDEPQTREIIDTFDGAEEISKWDL